MAYTYIPSFKKLIYEDQEYELQFFSYIAGGFGSGMRKSFEELITMTDTNGSYITSTNMVKLLRKHKQNPLL